MKPLYRVWPGIYFVGIIRRNRLMVKFFLPALRRYPQAMSASIRSRWVPVLFLLPLLLYWLLRSAETELTNLIIPLFPVEEDKSFTFYKDFVRLCLNEMLWLSFFLLLAWIAYVYFPIGRVLNSRPVGTIREGAYYPALIIGVSFVGSILIAYFTLEGFANSGDEYVYLYQAETMAEGRLWNKSHPLDEFFLYSHIPQKDGISVGRFPPGWPLVLSLPFVLNISPLWLNPILGALSLWLFFSFARKYYGTRVAIWSLVSVAFTSFYLFNAASFFSHTLCFLLVVGFLYSLYLHLEKRVVFYALLAGACLGMTVITRYFNAVLLVIPVIIFLYYRYQWKSIPTLIWIGVGSMPFFIFLFWYNYEITGNPFLPVTVWADEREGLGFGVRGYTPFDGIEHFIRRVFLFLYWSSPALLLLYFIFLIKKMRSKAERFLHPEDYYLLMLIVGYYFYYHIGGNQYGPRFWFEGTPFLTLFVVKKLFDSRVQWGWALFAAGLAYCVVKMPYIVEREHRIVEERVDLTEAVSAAGVDNAVVFVATHTGILRPMGALDLTRNDLDYNGSVLYVRDIPERNSELMEFYPDRTFYRYVRDPENPKGKLIELP